MTGAVAAATSRVKVGTWILSALHRNPGITAKAVETLDEISGGRFVFGLGSGHAGRQAHAFGLPEDHVYGRFEEAVEIIVPLLRHGRADFEGTFHAARDLEQRPVGPRPGRIPIMIGAKGPKMLRLAALHADIWSWYVEERSDLAEFGPRLAALEAACVEVGRDPATIGRSAGIVVEPTPITGAAEALGRPDPRLGRGDRRRLSGRSRPAGFTNVEVMLWPPTLAALDAMAPGARAARRRLRREGSSLTAPTPAPPTRPVEITLTSELLAGLTTRERASLPVLLAACMEMDAIFWQEASGDRNAVLSGIDRSRPPVARGLQLRTLGSPPGKCAARSRRRPEADGCLPSIRPTWT